MRDADQRRAGIEEPPDRVEVVLGPLARLRLHQHERPVGCQRLADVARRRGRIAQVVERVEDADEVVAVARERIGARHLEPHPLGDAGLGGRFAGALDPARMGVEARERRGREGLGHDDRRGAVAAADVRHARPRLQLLDDALERGQPAAHQVLAVAGAEEDLRAGEETVVMIVPVQARAAAERLGKAVLVGEERRQDVVRTEQVELALIVGKRHRCSGGSVYVPLAAS